MTDRRLCLANTASGAPNAIETTDFVGVLEACTPGCLLSKARPNCTRKSFKLSCDTCHELSWLMMCFLHTPASVVHAAGGRVRLCPNRVRIALTH